MSRYYPCGTTDADIDALLEDVDDAEDWCRTCEKEQPGAVHRPHNGSGSFFECDVCGEVTDPLEFDE